MGKQGLAHLPGYELVSRLGRGAHATINLAVETATRRQVAVKHVIRRGPEDDKFIAQAETEVRGDEMQSPALRVDRDGQRSARLATLERQVDAHDLADRMAMSRHLGLLCRRARAPSR